MFHARNITEQQTLGKRELGMGYTPMIETFLHARESYHGNDGGEKPQSQSAILPPNMTVTG